MSIRIIFCPNNSQKSDKRKWVARCNVVWCMFIMFTFEVGSSLVKSTVQIEYIIITIIIIITTIMNYFINISVTFKAKQVSLSRFSLLFKIVKTLGFGQRKQLGDVTLSSGKF